MFPSGTQKQQTIQKEQDVKKRAFNYNRQSLVFSLALFALFAVLAYLFPYSGDDWGWGSQIGIERLEAWFTDYNGRYAGNLLVMALTRNKLICALTVSLLLVCVCVFPKLFASGKGVVPCVFGAVLLLTAPKDVFTQAVVWTSGFSNYVPPIVFTMLYFVLIRNVFEAEIPKYRSYTSVICAFIGFVGALFMENITVFNVLISVVIIADTYRRWKKICAPHIVYFLSSVAGAVLMFSNSAYGLIARREDFYRSSCIERGVLDTVTENFRHFFDNLLAGNFVGVLIFTLLCALLCCSLRKQDNKKSYTVSLRALWVNLISAVVIFSKSRLDDWEVLFESRSYAIITTALLFAVAVLYLVSAGVILFHGIRNESLKNKALFVYICIPFSAAPLMVVNPVGPRCFFPHCFMLTAVSVTVLVYLLDELKPSGEVRKKLGAFFAAAGVVAFSFLLGVYGVIHAYDKTRNEFAKKQADEGFKTVVVYYLPFSGYVWNGDPDCVPWDECYRKFYNMPDDVKFKFILRESFMDFAANFEK